MRRRKQKSCRHLFRSTYRQTDMRTDNTQEKKLFRWGLSRESVGSYIWLDPCLNIYGTTGQRFLPHKETNYFVFMRNLFLCESVTFSDGKSFCCTFCPTVSVESYEHKCLIRAESWIGDHTVHTLLRSYHVVIITKLYVTMILTLPSIHHGEKFRHECFLWVRFLKIVYSSKYCT